VTSSFERAYAEYRPVLKLLEEDNSGKAKEFMKALKSDPNEVVNTQFFQIIFAIFPTHFTTKKIKEVVFALFSSWLFIRCSRVGITGSASNTCSRAPAWLLMLCYRYWTTRKPSSKWPKSWGRWGGCRGRDRGRGRADRQLSSTLDPLRDSPPSGQQGTVPTL
jgi:hypothetical protein